MTTDLGFEVSTETLLKRHLHQLACDALTMQTACNLCGLAHSFAEVTKALVPYCPKGTDQVNQHPIAKAWLNKMADLAGVRVDDADWVNTLADVIAIRNQNTLENSNG